MLDTSGAANMLEYLDNLSDRFKNKLETVEQSYMSLDQRSRNGGERLDFGRRIMQREFKKILMYLPSLEAEIDKTLKFTMLDALQRAKQEARMLNKKIQDGHSRGVGRVELEEVEERFLRITGDLEFLQSNMELSLSVDQGLMQNIIEQSVYMHTKELDPKQVLMVLVGVPTEPKLKLLASQSISFRRDFVQSATEVVCQAVNSDNESGKRLPIFKENLRDLLRKGRARILDDQCVEVDLPPSPTGTIEVKVTILGVTVKAGIRTNIDLSNLKSEDLTVFLNETAARGCQDLDQSDLHSLDITRRKSMPGAEAGGTKAPVGVILPRPFRGGSLSLVREAYQELSSCLNQTSPFHPDSEAQTSTLRATSAAKLQEMLESMSSGMPDLEEAGDEVNVLIKAVEQLSVEEMQRSLSREPSPAQQMMDVSQVEGSPLPALERSIAFSAKTTIYEELATPQVKQDNRRFQVAEGQTKVQDGVAGVARRKLKTAPPLQSSAEPLDLCAASAPKDLNVSQAQSEPSLNQSHRGWEERGLDASLDASVQEDLREKSGFWDSVVETPMHDYSVWDVSNLVTPVNFVTGHLKYSDIQDLPRTNCLQSPAYMTWAQTMKVVMVTEPSHHKIGVYNEETFSLKGWFLGRQFMKTPLHVLYMEDTTVALIQEDGLHIYNLQDDKRNYQERQVFTGNYRGLAEGEEGELITIQTLDQQIFIRILGKSSTNDIYSEVAEIPLTDTKSDWTFGRPSPENLVYWEQKIFITDSVMARIYVVDRNTGAQDSYGSCGDGFTQFKTPMGILQDEEGNLLISDHETSDILVFNARVRFVKRLKNPTSLTNPMGFLRLGNTVLLCFQGENGKNGGIARLELNGDSVLP